MAAKKKPTPEELAEAVIFALWDKWTDEILEDDSGADIDIMANFAKRTGSAPIGPESIQYLGFRAGLLKGVALADKFNKLINGELTLDNLEA